MARLLPLAHYILVDRKPVLCTLMEWATWYNEERRRVAETHTPFHSISTVFLGIDHNFSGVGPPVLFETAVFLEEYDRPSISRRPTRPCVDIARYSYWDHAAAGHNQMVRQWLEVEHQAANATAKLLEGARDGKG